MPPDLAQPKEGGSQMGRMNKKKGEKVTTDLEITQAFATYYFDLYKDKELRGTEEIKTFLDNLDIATLSEGNNETLEGGLMLDEVSEAIKNMQFGKTPGPNGTPSEF